MPNLPPRPAPPVQLAGSGTGDRHLTDYLRMLYRRRWIASAALLVIFGIGAVNTFKAKPVYEAKVQIMIEKDPSRMASLNELFQSAESWYNFEFYETQYRVLQSRTVARRTLDSLQLWDHGEFGGPLGAKKTKQEEPTGFWGAVASARRSVRQFLSSEEAQSAQATVPAPEPDETALQSPRISAFLGRVTVSPVKNSRLVELKFRASEPKLAAGAANEMAKQYIQHSLESKSVSTKSATDWLNKELEEQRLKVQESEVALQRYRETHDAGAVDDPRNIVVQKLADLNTAVTKAKTDRLQREVLYTQIRGLQDQNASLDSLPAVLTNSYIQEIKVELSQLRRQEAQLADSLGEKHPEMIKTRTAVEGAQAKLQAEIAKVVESVRSEFLSAQAQERTLEAALNRQKGEALAFNRKGIEFGVLERDAISNRQIYESLMQRAKEAGISGDYKTTNLRILDPAEPPLGPISPNHQKDLLVALAFGLVVALCVSFFFEYIDNRIKTPEELKGLGLPFLGMVPTIPAKELRGSPLINNGVPPRFLEAILSVRTNVLFSSAEEGARTIVITSASQGEGKTLVASNLAMSLAMAGQRVVLIDADLRRPHVHDMFERDLEPGLSNVLVGTTPAADAAIETDVDGLWVLPAGHIPPNPADLVGSARFQDLLVGLRASADWIVIDSPPVLAVTDASVLANTATGVIFVVGNEMTTLTAAAAAVDQLRRANAKFIGAVLNRVNIHRHAYYYAAYYRRKDEKYYVKQTSTARGA